MDLGHGDRWRLDACPACPAQTLPLGRFDVSDRPGPATRYDPTAGHRINTITGLPECVHPHRLQLPTGRYASNGEPAPVPAPQQPQDPSLPPPDEVGELEAWLSPELTRGVLIRQRLLHDARQQVHRGDDPGRWVGPIGPTQP